MSEGKVSGGKTSHAGALTGRGTGGGMNGGMKIAVLGDVETVVGFSLGGAGLRYPVEDLMGAEKALNEIMQRGDVAVLIITERFSRLLAEDINRWKEEHPVFPLIVEVPGFKEKTRGTDRVNALIKKAVGISLSDEGVEMKKEKAGEKR